MLTLRILGVLAGGLGFVLVHYLRFRRRRLRNLEWLLGNALSLGLVLLGFFPDVLNAFLAFFSFEKGGGGRLIGLLIFSNLLAYVLIYAALARANRLEEQLDRLVRELAKREYRQQHRPAEAPIHVIIPAYNEAPTIADVLERIPREVFGLRTKTLVVVDGATDETEAIVRRLNR